MDKKELISKIAQHSKEFDNIWTKIVTDINKYIEEHPEEKSFYPFQCTCIESLIDSLCLSGAWIHDRLNDKSGLPGNPNYRDSKTKQIRKVLGYNI